MVTGTCQNAANISWQQKTDFFLSMLKATNIFVPTFFTKYLPKFTPIEQRREYLRPKTF